jgi:hypothetical protein
VYFAPLIVAAAGEQARRALWLATAASEPPGRARDNTKEWLVYFVDVEMREQEGAGAGIDEDARSAIDENDITGAGAAEARNSEMEFHWRRGHHIAGIM